VGLACTPTESICSLPALRSPDLDALLDTREEPESTPSKPPYQGTSRGSATETQIRYRGRFLVEINDVTANVNTVP
jgi:hypothetical protein